MQLQVKSIWQGQEMAHRWEWPVIDRKWINLVPDLEWAIVDFKVVIEVIEGVKDMKTQGHSLWIRFMVILIVC